MQEAYENGQLKGRRIIEPIVSMALRWWQTKPTWHKQHSRVDQFTNFSEFALLGSGLELQTLKYLFDLKNVGFQCFDKEK